MLWSSSIHTQRNGKIRLPMPESGIFNHGVNIYSYRTTMHNRQCTYLNSNLLMAHHEYVLHGLVPGMYWAHLWPLLMSMHLVATANPLYNCLWQRLKFHLNVFCCLCGFSLMNKQGSIYWKIPSPLGGGNISRCHLGEKIWKGEEKKGENVKEKGIKGKEKGRKGKKMRKGEVKG